MGLSEKKNVDLGGEEIRKSDYLSFKTKKTGLIKRPVYTFILECVEEKGSQIFQDLAPLVFVFPRHETYELMCFNTKSIFSLY
jgi:hypothetical protein